MLTALRHQQHRMIRVFCERQCKSHVVLPSQPQAASLAWSGPGQDSVCNFSIMLVTPAVGGWCALPFSPLVSQELHNYNLLL
jgi:hypothetical protein